MSVYALCSCGGSPGVTTAALALALAWPPPVVLAECDPAGGSILAGLFAGHMPAPRGLLGAAFDAGVGGTLLSAGPGGQLAPLDDIGSRTFMAGLTDPRQAPGLVPAWPGIARMLAAQPGDVIADCGRLDAADTQPIPVLAKAELVIAVLRPTLRQVAAAGPRIEMLTQLRGSRDRIGLLLVGDQGHHPAEISRTLGVGVLATLPADPRTAAVLSDGVGRRGSLADRPLMRAAKTALKALAAAAATNGAAAATAAPAMPPGTGAGGSAGPEHLAGGDELSGLDSLACAHGPAVNGQGDAHGRRP